MLPWVKGMNVDVKNGVLITWSMGLRGNQSFVAFNRLYNRERAGGDGKQGAPISEEERKEKVEETAKKFVKELKPYGEIVEGLTEITAALEEKEVTLLVMATDVTDQKFRKNFLNHAKASGVPVLEAGTREMLGEWLGSYK